MKFHDTFRSPTWCRILSINSSIDEVCNPTYDLILSAHDCTFLQIRFLKKIYSMHFERSSDQLNGLNGILFCSLPSPPYKCKRDPKSNKLKNWRPSSWRSWHGTKHWWGQGNLLGWDILGQSVGLTDSMELKMCWQNICFSLYQNPPWNMGYV